MDRQKYDIQRIVYNIFLTKHDTIPYTPTGSASLHICCSVTANVLQRYCIYAAVTLHMCCSATAYVLQRHCKAECSSTAKSMHLLCSGNALSHRLIMKGDVIQLSLSIINLQRRSFQVFQSKRRTSKKGLQIIDL